MFEKQPCACFWAMAETECLIMHHGNDQIQIAHRDPGII